MNFSISKESFALKTDFRATELRQRPKFHIFLKALFRTLASNRNLVLKAVLIVTVQYL